MKINKMLLMAATVMVTAAGAQADDWWNSHMYYAKDNQPLFNANELSFDLFGAYQAPERHFLAFPNTSIHHGNWGGGVGANYFFTPVLGVGVDTAFLDGTQRFDDHVGGNLYVRIPIEPIHLAPYVFGGGGRSFNPNWNWYADVGVGLESRFNPKVGLFGDARYIWKDGSNSPDQASIRSGLRFVF